MRRQPHCLPVAFFLLAAILPLGAQGAPKILVVDNVLAPGIDPVLAGPISDYILAALMESGKYTVLDRRNMDAVLEEQSFRLSGLVADAEVGRAGQMMGAQVVVVPRLAKLAETWFLSARMIDVETGIVRAQCAIEKTGARSAVPSMGTEAGRTLSAGAAAYAATSSPASVAPIALSLTVMDSSPMARVVVEDAIGHFRTRYPAASFKVAYCGEFDAAAKKSMISGTGPDMLWQVSNNLPWLASAKAIMPLDGLDALPGYDPRAAAVSRYSDRNYGVTVSLGDTIFLLYRTDLVASPPDSMEGIIAMAKALAKQGIKPLVWPVEDAYTFVAWLAAFGTDFMDVKGKFSLDPLKLRQALKEYGKDVSALGIKGYTYDKCQANFHAGRAAMYLTGDWNLAAMYAPDSSLRGVIRATRLPAIGKKSLSSYLGGRSLMAGAGLSREKETAVRQFMEIMISPEVQRGVLFHLNRIPSSDDPSIKRSIAMDPLYSAVAVATDGSRPMPRLNSDPQAFYASWNWWIKEYLEGRKPLEEASDTMYLIAKDKLK